MQRVGGIIARNFSGMNISIVIAIVIDDSITINLYIYLFFA